MRILLVNNSIMALNQWHQAGVLAYPKDEIQTFEDPMLAIKECVNRTPDRIFAACTMRKLDGFTVLKMLREKYPNLPVCLVGTCESDEKDAHSLMAAGYMEAPVTTDKLAEFERVYIKTNFDD